MFFLPGSGTLFIGSTFCANGEGTMFTAATFALLLWIAPPLDLSDDERAEVYKMAQEYKYKAHCETGVLARVFLINGEKKIYMRCFNGVTV